MPVWMIHILLCTLWISVHVFVIHYGADQLPYHEAYIGDERAPITGALHVLAEHSLLALNGLETMYYGPLFAVLALPAVFLDFVFSSLANSLLSPTWYKNYVLYDWGGALVLARIITLMVSYAGLVGFHKLLSTKSINSNNLPWLPLFGVFILATDFYFFSYGSFFRFWIFILVPVLWQMYYLILLFEQPNKKTKYLINHGLLAVFAFGINYPSIISQVILLPWFYSQYRKMGFKETIKVSFPYITILFIGCCVIALWNMQRLIVWTSIFLTDTLRLGQSEVSLTQVGERVVSFPYYFEILSHNYFSLVAALVLLVFLCDRKAILSLNNSIKYFLTSVILFGLSYGVLLGSHPVHVSRYVLPTVITLIVLVATMLSVTFIQLPRIWRLVIILLLLFQVLFHSVSVYFWLDMNREGPSMRNEVFEILDEQSVFSGVSQVVTPPKLLGWPHTKRSYAQYSTLLNEDYRPLFKSYQESVSPKIQLLDVDYAHTVSDIDFSKYKIVYVCTDPILNGQLPVDYPEVRLVRLWIDEKTWQPGCTKIAF